MSTVTVSTALDHIARLIPVSPAASASRLTGHAVWVLTSPGELPEAFREAQAARTAHYMTTHGDESNGRVPGDALAGRAPRYVVTSYGVPVAWVTLDGRTHFANLPEPMLPGTASDHGITARHAAMTRHRDAIRAAWPERFLLDSMGDPVSNEHGQLLRHDGLPAYRNHLPSTV